MEKIIIMISVLYVLEMIKVMGLVENVEKSMKTIEKI